MLGKLGLYAISNQNFEPLNLLPGFHVAGRCVTSREILKSAYCKKFLVLQSSPIRIILFYLVSAQRDYTVLFKFSTIAGSFFEVFNWFKLF